jgi:hypothetical protein
MGLYDLADHYEERRRTGWLQRGKQPQLLQDADTFGEAVFGDWPEWQARKS